MGLSAPLPSDNTPNAVWIWDIQKLRLFVVLEQLSPVRAFQWDPQRPRLAICTGGSQVYLWSRAGCVSVQVPGEGEHSAPPTGDRGSGSAHPPNPLSTHLTGRWPVLCGREGPPRQGGFGLSLGHSDLSAHPGVWAALRGDPGLTHSKSSGHLPPSGDFQVLSLCWHLSGDSLALLSKDHFCLCFLETEEGPRLASGQLGDHT